MRFKNLKVGMVLHLPELPSVMERDIEIIEREPERVRVINVARQYRSWISRVIWDKRYANIATLLTQPKLNTPLPLLGGDAKPVLERLDAIEAAIVRLGDVRSGPGRSL